MTLTEFQTAVEKRSMKSLRDWRQALRTPHVYRVGNSTFRIQRQFFTAFVSIVIVLLMFYTYPALRRSLASSRLTAEGCAPAASSCHYYKYNKTYPISSPVKTMTGISYRIAIISDLDLDSKSSDASNTWFSIMLKGTVLWMPQRNFISVTWDEHHTILSSSLSMKGRGMELSELVTFDGRLLAVDDRTGMVYSVEGERVFPWVILMDGNGKSSKGNNAELTSSQSLTQGCLNLGHTHWLRASRVGTQNSVCGPVSCLRDPRQMANAGFKSEWATVKDEQLYVGSMGKEWTTSLGEFVSNDPQWIKTISVLGETHSINWVSNYKRLRQALNIEFPGYMIHESGVWSEIHKNWFFLPRRCSEEQYNETKDETMGCNVLLTADENFLNIKVTRVGNLVPIRGFASFKFLPGSKDEIIVALKTEENQGRTATYITAFTIEGSLLMPEIKILDKKFEGLEFI